MNLVSYAHDFHQAQSLLSHGVKEIILEEKHLSRFGKLTIKELNLLARKCKDLEIKTVLEFDILLTENQFSKTLEKFKQVDIELFDSIRVQDPGVLNYILENTDLKIQFISQTGNHNLLGLKSWKELIADRLDRLVLSIELPKKDLIDYKKELDCSIEFMVFGRILLFYTPRNLLSSLAPEDDELKTKEVITALGESEESPHKGFPLIENMHGTFMFHIKNHCIVSNIQDCLNDFVWNLDLRFDNDFDYLESLTEIMNEKKTLQEFKDLYPRDYIKGFFNINKSDVLFKKLKNSRLQREDESYIGEVLEIKKSEYLIIKTYNDFKAEENSQIEFITPEGKKMSAPLIFLKDSAMNDCKEISKGKLMAMNYMSGVWVKSKAYLRN